MPHSFAGSTAIAGIGATEFSKDSGRSELRLAVEAVGAALEDAGVTPSEVQGMVTFSSDTNPDIDIARSLGVGDLTFFSRIHYGGGAACATNQQAALAVSSGVADVVVCYRAFNERSGNRFGAGVQGRAPMHALATRPAKACAANRPPPPPARQPPPRRPATRR